jgi:hypothetical protein
MDEFQFQFTLTFESSEAIALILGCSKIEAEQKILSGQQQDIRAQIAKLNACYDDWKENGRVNVPREGCDPWLPNGMTLTQHVYETGPNGFQCRNCGRLKTTGDDRFA